MKHSHALFLLAVLFLSGCAFSDRVQRLETEKAQLAATLSKVKDEASVEKAAHLAAVEADKGHAAKVRTLEEQQAEQLQRLAADKAELTRINGQLQAERDAVIRERLYWWSGICAVAAGLVCVAGFFLPGMNVWLWRGSAGLGVLAAVLVALAPLSGWFRWGGSAIIVGVLGWLAWEAFRHSQALTGIVSGFEQLKDKVGDSYKDVMRNELGKARAVVDRLRAKG